MGGWGETKAGKTNGEYTITKRKKGHMTPPLHLQIIHSFVNVLMIQNPVVIFQDFLLYLAALLLFDWVLIIKSRQTVNERPVTVTVATGSPPRTHS